MPKKRKSPERRVRWKVPPEETERPRRQWQPAPGRRRWQKGVSASKDERPNMLRPKSGKQDPRTLPWWDRRRYRRKPLKRYSIDKGNPDVRRQVRTLRRAKKQGG